MEDTSADGIFYLPERPWSASSDPKDSYPFGWRGVDEDGYIKCGDNFFGWISFLGSGQIVGNFCELSPEGYDIEFQGQRTSGSQTRAPRDALSMQAEFEDYEVELNEGS